MREFILVCWFLPWIRPKIECFSGSVKRKLLKIQGFRPLPGCARRLRGGNRAFPQCLRALFDCKWRLFGCNSRLFECKCRLSGCQWRLLDCRRRLLVRQCTLPDCQWRLLNCKWWLIEALLFLKRRRRRGFEDQRCWILRDCRNATSASISAGVRFAAYAGMFTSPLAIFKTI